MKYIGLQFCFYYTEHRVFLVWYCQPFTFFTECRGGEEGKDLGALALTIFAMTSILLHNRYRVN